MDGKNPKLDEVELPLLGSKPIELDPETNQENSGQMSPESANANKVEEKGVICPKCGFKQGGGNTCNKCGLEFRKWHDGMEKAQFADIPAAILDHAESMWNEFVSDNTNEEKLKKFHDFCLSRNSMTYAAFCYRKYLVDKPEDQFVLSFQKKTVEQAWLMLPETSQMQRQEPLPRKWLFVGGLAAVLLTFLSTWFFLKILE